MVRYSTTIQTAHCHNDVKTTREGTNIANTKSWLDYNDSFRIRILISESLCAGKYICCMYIQIMLYIEDLTDRQLHCTGIWGSHTLINTCNEYSIYGYYCFGLCRLISAAQWNEVEMDRSEDSQGQNL